mgnify:CR=1 FL=1|jgi:hypothetical protein
MINSVLPEQTIKLSVRLIRPASKTKESFKDVTIRSLFFGNTGAEYASIEVSVLLQCGKNKNNRKSRIYPLVDLMQIIVCMFYVILES